MTLLGLVSQSEHLAPGSGDDGSDRAIPTFHHVHELHIAGSRPEDALSPIPHPLTNPKQICKAGCPRSRCGVPCSQHQHSFVSGAVVSCLHNAGFVLLKLQISHFPRDSLCGKQQWETGAWGLVWSCLWLPLPESRNSQQVHGFPFSNWTTWSLVLSSNSVASPCPDANFPFS